MTPKKDNVRKIVMNAVLPSLRGLGGHNRSREQALAPAKAIRERWNDGFLAVNSRKEPSAINQLRNIGSHSSLISRSHLEFARSVYSGKNQSDINEAQESHGDHLKVLQAVATMVTSASFLPTDAEQHQTLRTPSIATGVSIDKPPARRFRVSGVLIPLRLSR